MSNLPIATMAVPQSLTTTQHPPLRLDIPGSQHLQLSSPQERHHQSFPSSPLMTGYEPYSRLATIVNPFPMRVAQPKYNIGAASPPYSRNVVVQTWNRPTSSSSSITVSTSMSPPEAPSKPLTSSSQTSPSPYSPKGLLGGVLLPFAKFGMPQWQEPSTVPRQSEEDMTFDYGSFLRDLTPSPVPSVRTTNLREQLLKFNRILRAPRGKMEKRTAGKWTHDDTKLAERVENMSIRSGPSIGDNSVQSAPSILCA